MNYEDDVREPRKMPAVLLRLRPSPRRREEVTPVKIGMRPTTSRAEMPAPVYLTPVYCSQK